MNVPEPEKQERGKTEVEGNEGIRYWSLCTVGEHFN